MGSMMLVITGRSGAIAALTLLGAAASLGGCVSGPATSTVNLHSQLRYSGKIDNLFVAISVDNIPGDFGLALTTSLQRSLGDRGVRSTVRAVSDLDLEPVLSSEYSSYRYVMFCRPTHIERYQAVINAITMNCSAVDVRTRAVVLKADVRTIRGVGFRPFGEKEADRASAELVNRMQGADLLALASPILSPFQAQVQTAVAPLPPARTSAPVAVETWSAQDQPTQPWPAVSAPVAQKPSAGPAENGRIVDLKVLPNGEVQEARERP